MQTAVIRLPGAIALAIALAVLSVPPMAHGAGARAVPHPRGPSEQLVFFDDFNGPLINTSVWKHELTLSGGGNWEFEAYLNNRSVSFVQNSSLVIRPRLMSETVGTAGLMNAELNIWGGDPSTTCTDNQFYGCDRTGGAGGNVLNPVVSARVRTAETFAMKYGRVEVVAQLPKGDFLWPAIWLLPSQAAYGDWPASGEIDIMESRGNARGYPSGGCDTMSSTLHFGPGWPQDGFLSAHAAYSIPQGDLTTGLHTYGLFWNATHMQTYVDDTVVLNLDVSNTSFWERGGWANSNLDNPWEGMPSNAPFDQKFYLILNLAVGGTNGYFPDGQGNKPWSDTDPHAVNAFWNAVNQWYPTWTQPFVIDKVSVWQVPGSGAENTLRPMI